MGASQPSFCANIRSLSHSAKISVSARGAPSSIRIVVEPARAAAANCRATKIFTGAPKPSGSFCKPQRYQLPSRLFLRKAAVYFARESR